MNEIKVQIDAESVNEYVAKAILDSKLGEQLKKTIEEEIGKLGRSYDNPLQAAVTQIIRDTIRDMLLHDERYQSKIRAAIEEHITDVVIADIIDKSWDALANRWR